ncbi:MAG: hypothetical protein ACP5U1_15080, partial [Desulfomonilaceae bacterium]
MKTSTVALLVAFFISALLGGVGFAKCSNCAQEPVSRITESAWKMGRGITNIVFSPCQLFSVMTDLATKGAYEGSYGSGFRGYVSGAIQGYLAGSVVGL